MDSALCARPTLVPSSLITIPHVAEIVCQRNNLDRGFLSWPLANSPNWCCRPTPDTENAPPYQLRHVARKTHSSRAHPLYLPDACLIIARSLISLVAPCGQHHSIVRVLCQSSLQRGLIASSNLQWSKLSSLAAPPDEPSPPNHRRKNLAACCCPGNFLVNMPERFINTDIHSKTRTTIDV